MNLPINDIDAEIIKLLNANGRTPNTEIAKKLNLSETAIRNIVNHLKEDYGDFGIRQALKQFVTARQVEDFLDTIT